MAHFDKLSVPILKQPEPVEGCFYPKLLRRYFFSVYSVYSVCSVVV